jgi:pyridoxal phosphate enzyme (YggS family)
MSDIDRNLQALDREMRACESRYGRSPGSVRLLAVSKRQPASAIRRAYTAGQRAFGENFLQEAFTKQHELAGLDLEWHFIGAIQSNKTAEIARRFDWVHTLDRAKVADRLSQQRPPETAPLNVLIQVNISGEASKSGVAPSQLPALVAHVRSLPRLHLGGLMAMPAPVQGLSAQRKAFAQLAALAAASEPALDTLSMGTSDDFIAAIAEGASFIRLGTAVFGPRPDAA